MCMFVNKKTIKGALNEQKIKDLTAELATIRKENAKQSRVNQIHGY